MFFVRFIFVFILCLSIVRLTAEATRLSLCLLANKKFATTRVGNLLTALSVSYIITILSCGIPS